MRYSATTTWCVQCTFIFHLISCHMEWMLHTKIRDTHTHTCTHERAHELPNVWSEAEARRILHTRGFVLFLSFFGMLMVASCHSPELKCWNDARAPCDDGTLCRKRKRNAVTGRCISFPLDWFPETTCQPNDFGWSAKLSPTGTVYGSA